MNLLAIWGKTNWYCERESCTTYKEIVGGNDKDAFNECCDCKFRVIEDVEAGLIEKDSSYQDYISGLELKPKEGC